MPQATSKAAQPSVSSEPKLNKSVFGVMPSNHELLKLAYLSYLANGRQNNAKTKTRGMVSGGGRKPWRQKGTGRARVGSSRTPIWAGGGVIFGPTGNENYSYHLSQNERKLALKQALSLAASEKRIIINDIDSKHGKTGDVVKLLEKVGFRGRGLIVADSIDQQLSRSLQNLSHKVKLVREMNLNVYDVMNADSIIISPKSLINIDNWLGK
jgi:large subunit ribosomal protein L4